MPQSPQSCFTMRVSAFNTHEVMSGNLNLCCSAVDVPCQPHCFENNLLTATRRAVEKQQWRFSLGSLLQCFSNGLNRCSTSHVWIVEVIKGVLRASSAKIENGYPRCANAIMLPSEIVRKLKKPASIINGLSRLAQHQAQISVEQLLMLLRQTVSHCFESLLGLVI